MTKTNMKRRAVWLLAGIAISIALVAIAFRQTYIALIFCRIGIYTIVVSGLDILFGYTGQISLGHAAFFAIGAYTSAYFSINCGLNAVFTILMGCVLSMVIGALLALPASRLVKHFLSLLTIAFGQLVYTFANSTRSITGGASGLKDIPNISLFGYQIDTYAKNFILIAVIMVVMIAAKRNLINSRIGRAFIAIRENTQAAYSSGINVRAYKVLAFVISAFYTGLGGGLFGHLINFVSPDSFNSTQSVLFMTILLFGGLANLAGPLIGSIVLLTLKELLQSFSTYQMLIYAILILIVLFLLPDGIAGILKKLEKRIQGAVRKQSHNAASAGTPQEEMPC